MTFEKCRVSSRSHRVWVLTHFQPDPKLLKRFRPSFISFPDISVHRHLFNIHRWQLTLSNPHGADLGHFTSPSESAQRPPFAVFIQLEFFCNLGLPHSFCCVRVYTITMPMMSSKSLNWCDFYSYANITYSAVLIARMPSHAAKAPNAHSNNDTPHIHGIIEPSSYIPYLV
jgi:hypothetical protein